MKRMAICFLLLAGAAFAVEGQVFIVTKSGANLKLGLVTVGVYPYEYVEKYVTATKAEFRPKAEQYNLESNQHFEAYKKLSAKGKTEGTTEELNASTFALQKSLLLFHFFFADFPTAGAVAKTKTDADGRFKLDGSFGDGVLLVAFAKREIGDETETYTWVLPPKEWDTPLFLSNDNLFELSSLAPLPELFSGDKGSRKAFYLKVRKESADAELKTAASGKEAGEKSK